MLMMVEKLVMKKKVFSKLRLLGGKIQCVKSVVAFLSLQELSQDTRGKSMNVKNLCAKNVD